jgi:glycerophosphoryl diester phosphodiesterase
MFQRNGRPFVWAHRGASALAPENTLSAFELASRLGADGVELDAQRCATGEVVVHHDYSLARTTGRASLLAETPWSVVRRLDAGARFDPRFAGERVPLLADVLFSLPGELAINVELKCETIDDRGLTRAVCRVIADARAEERVLVSSFNPVCLLRARALAPRLQRALLFDENSAWAFRGALAGAALGAIALHPGRSMARPHTVRRWRRSGFLVAPWTVDDLDEARGLSSAGVSGLITNAPDKILAALTTH